jgi:hypothetical protein
MKAHWLNACPTIPWLRVRVHPLLQVLGEKKANMGMLSAQAARNGYGGSHSKNNRLHVLPKTKAFH